MSLPHFTPRIVVFVGSALLTIVATRATFAADDVPTDPFGWPRRFLRRVADGFRAGGRETGWWVAVGLHSLVVAVMHFGGLEYGIYTQIAWWDLATHALSGIGVALLLWLTFHWHEDRSPLWISPAVLAFAAGFEVYEFVFKTFWYEWSLRLYVTDTAVDLLLGWAGGSLVVAALVGWRALTAPSPGPAADAD